MEYGMESTRRFTLRHLLMATIVVAVLLAIPMHAHRVSVSIPFAFWGWLGYNALVLAAIAYPIYRLFNRPRLIFAVSAVLYLLNFMPVLANAIDWSLTGSSDATGSWLADHGLDYDPFISIPCYFGVKKCG